MTKQKNLNNKLFILISIPIFWFLIGYVLIPMFNTLLISLQTNDGFGIQNYINYMTNPNGMTVIKNTFILGIATVIVCCIVGTFLAIGLFFIKMPCKKLIHVLLLSPMMIPGVLIVISFIQLYGESGLVTNLIKVIFNLENVPFYLQGFSGILFIHAYTQYVYFYINVTLALSFVDSSAIEAARGMGASKIHLLKTIILPTILPAILSSSIVTFISGISSFSAPNLLGGKFKVLSTQIMMSKVNNYMNIASMQVVILMIMGISVLFLMRYYEKKFAIERNLKATSFSSYKIKNPLLSFFYQAIIWLFVLSIILPLIAICFLSFVDSSSLMTEIFPTSFTLDNFFKIFNKKRVWKPFANSITMTTISIFIGLIITLPASYLATKKSNKINTAMEFLIMLPLTMPVSSIAINLINTFNRKTVFAFGNSLIGTYWILPIAYILVAMPLLMRTNMLSMRNFNINLEYASNSLGANKLHTFLNITTPLIMPSILSGAILVFIRTIGEYTMSALLYGVHNQPISIAMVSAIQEYDIGLSMAYGALIVVICLVGMCLKNIIKSD